MVKFTLVCRRDRQERARRKRQQDTDQLWGDILRTLWHRIRLRNEYGNAGAQGELATLAVYVVDLAPLCVNLIGCHACCFTLVRAAIGQDRA